MQVERLRTGAWCIYGVVNGYLINRIYVGHTRGEAIKSWKIEAGE